MLADFALEYCAAIERFSCQWTDRSWVDLISLTLRVHHGSCIHTATDDPVYLSLKGTVYANNSVIPITEIGETNSTSNAGLQCITNRIPCCSTTPNRHGEWLFPNGTTVPGPLGYPTSFSRTRGDDGTVNLNRLNTNIFIPTGPFCCVVPDAQGDIQRLCINISEQRLHVIISYYY